MPYISTIHLPGFHKIAGTTKYKCHFVFYHNQGGMVYTCGKMLLTHCRLNRLSHTIYSKSPISILGMSGYEIYRSLEENG